MIKNLSEYFLPEQEFYLQSISYERIEKSIDQKEHSLNCIDNIRVNVYGKEKIRIIVTRSLNFDPEEMFSMSVSFGAILKFNPDKYEDYDWHNINLADEFKNNGDFVIGNLAARISLQIAQITSAFGQMPIVLPPTIAKAPVNAKQK